MVTCGMSLSACTHATTTVSAGETSVILLIVLVGRILGTLTEQRWSMWTKFGPRRSHVKKYLELLVRDGPLKLRLLCLCLVFAQLLIAPVRSAFYGRWVYLARQTADES